MSKKNSADRPQPAPFTDDELREIAARAKRLSDIAAALRMAYDDRDVSSCARSVASALFRLVEAFNPGGRFGDKPLPEVPALLRPRESGIGTLLTRIRWAMRKIGGAVGYDPSLGYRPKIGQVAKEHVYAFVESIRADDSRYVDDLASAADELLVELAANSRGHSAGNAEISEHKTTPPAPATCPVTPAEVVAAMLGTGPPLTGTKLEAAGGMVTTPSPDVVQSLEIRIRPDGNRIGSPVALRVFDALNAGQLKPATFAGEAVADEPPAAATAAPNPGKGEGDDIPDLHPLDKKVLPAMLALGAVSYETRRTAANIAFHAEKVHGATQAYKQRLPELQRLGLTSSKRGKTGGHWLTLDGLQVAKRLSANGSYDLGQS